MLNSNWVEKLKLKCIDEPNGGMIIEIEWDEADPDLQWWTGLGPKGQENFMIDALWNALECYIDDDLTQPVD